METLQNVVLPNLEVQGDETLYLRVDGRAHCERGAPCVRFEDGGECRSDTFYGGFTLGAWHEATVVGDLFLELHGDGAFLASLAVRRTGHDVRWLAEQEVEVAPGAPIRLAVPGWRHFRAGLLYFRLRARRPGTLVAARYVTPAAAPVDVQLGIVITHFNRPAMVLPAIERLRREVLENPQARGRITLTVVDNSANLDLRPAPGVTCLPNRNFGGSGGFARGLLRLHDAGVASHVLFMDDDASCEGESVLRCLALLRFARSPRLAVAGALVSEAEPWRLLEKGACFDGKCRPLHHGADLRRVDELLSVERRQARIHYGGWWFFAFPLRELRHYPFPFFVRGDDVFFSLQNDFEIRTLNGIACQAEDFAVKHGPMTAYLDARYHLLHALLRERGGLRVMRRLVNNQFFKPLLAYQYSSARAFTLALRHLRRGPGFFRDNLDLGAVRREIAAWQPSERLEPVDLDGLRLRQPRTGKEHPARRLARILTLQGFLLPRALLKERVQLHEKSYYGRAGAVFGSRRVLYQHLPSDTGWIAEHDHRAFYREAGALLRELSGLLRDRRRLRDEFRREMPRLACREFWSTVYRDLGPCTGRVDAPHASGPGEAPAPVPAPTHRPAPAPVGSATREPSILRRLAPVRGGAVRDGGSRRP